MEELEKMVVFVCSDLCKYNKGNQCERCELADRWKAVINSIEKEK